MPFTAQRILNFFFIDGESGQLHASASLYGRGGEENNP
jgi:hypothetical protein